MHHDELYPPCPVLYLAIPCYNEEAVLPITAGRVLSKLLTLVQDGTVSDASRILLIDDGSRDRTWELIAGLCRIDIHYSGLRLSRNRGHQNALLAGLMHARQKADTVISMDADLQDDIDAIDAFLAAYRDGCDIVYGVRSKRETDSFFKRSTALAFYRLMRAMGVESVYNHADYRLMSRRALDHLANYGEVNLFLRGIIPLIGFRSTQVLYERHERAAGESKYPLKKMLAFAIDGITSFSIKPLRLITTLGFLIFLISIAALFYSLIGKLLGVTVIGWTTIIASIWLLGGLQLLSLGIMGEYIGKIYSEVKARPRFIVDEIIDRADSAVSGADQTDG